MEVSGKLKRSGKNVLVGKTDKICEPCKGENITKQSDGFCKDCEEYMCNICFTHHLKAKLCRNHVMVKGQMPSTSSLLGCVDSEVKCKQHAGETVKFYCPKHDVVGCGDCVVLKHNDCKAEFISHLSENFQHSQEFKTLMSKIEQLAFVNSKNGEKIQVNKRNTEVLLEKALSEIRKFRLKVNTYLDNVERSVISEAKALKTENEKMLIKLESNCELLSTKIEDIRQKLDVKCFQHNTLFINTVETKPNVAEIENKVAETQAKQFKNFEFIPDKQLQDLVTSNKRLGQLVTTVVTLNPQNTRATEAVKEVASDKADTGMETAHTIKVGARVRHYLAKYPEGTVTKVHSDGTVNVKWDNLKTILGPYKIGAGSDEVYPI